MRNILFLLWWFPLQVPAQQHGLPWLTLKTNASALANPFKPAAAVSTDLRLGPNISADLGAGAFIGSPHFADHEGESYKGLRLRAGAKYHLIQADRRSFYVGIEAKYHDIRHISIRQVFRQGQQYLEFLPVERTIRSQGVAARVGWQLYFGPNKRLLLEPYAGLGMVYHRVERRLPPDAEWADDGSVFVFEFEPGTHTVPDLLLGLQIGIALW